MTFEPCCTFGHRCLDRREHAAYVPLRHPERSCRLRRMKLAEHIVPNIAVFVVDQDVSRRRVGGSDPCVTDLIPSDVWQREQHEVVIFDSLAYGVVLFETGCVEGNLL